MKIIIISTSGFKKKEGISTVIFDYFSRFSKELFETHIVIDGNYDESLVNEFEKAGLILKFLPSRKHSLFSYIKVLVSIFKKEGYDAIYIHGSSAIMSIELLIAKLCNCKVRVVHSHNTTCKHRIADTILRPLFNNLYTDAFACGNKAGKWLFGNRTFTVVCNGRDLSKYSFDETKRKEVRQRLKIDDDYLVVGHVGNFNQQKNQRFVLEVFKSLIEIREKSVLYLIGTGDELDEIRELASKMGIADKVVFTGSISNVDEMLQAMDVMLLPSLHEGLPLVVIEWQIAALPSLISDCITSECKYSDLVHFMSLNEPDRKWANELIHISAHDRKSNADKMIELARKNGYDINENVLKLQKVFMDAKC